MFWSTCALGSARVRLDLDGNNFDLSLTPAQELIRSLETLSEMYEEGLLTDEEFQEAKSQLLL